MEMPQVVDLRYRQAYFLRKGLVCSSESHGIKWAAERFRKHQTLIFKRTIQLGPIKQPLPLVYSQHRYRLFIQVYHSPAAVGLGRLKYKPVF